MGRLNQQRLPLDINYTNIKKILMAANTIWLYHEKSVTAQGSLYFYIHQTVYWNPCSHSLLRDTMQSSLLSDS